MQILQNNTEDTKKIVFIITFSINSQANIFPYHFIFPLNLHENAHICLMKNNCYSKL